MWKLRIQYYTSCCSVPQLFPPFCDPMDCSTPGLPVLHYFPEFAQTHALSCWCHPIISSSVISFSSCPQSFPASGYFPMSRLFASGGQRIGVSASASVLPMNIQSWFPLGLIGLFSLLSKELSRVFPNTTVQKHQLFGTQPFYGPPLTTINDYWKNHSFDYTDLCWQSDVCAF